MAAILPAAGAGTRWRRRPGTGGRAAVVAEAREVIGDAAGEIGEHIGQRPILVGRDLLRTGDEVGARGRRAHSGEHERALHTTPPRWRRLLFSDSNACSMPSDSPVTTLAGFAAAD